MLFGGPKKGAKKIDLSKAPKKIGTARSNFKEPDRKKNTTYKLRRQAEASIRKRQKEAHAVIEMLEAGLITRGPLARRPQVTNDDEVYRREQLQAARENAKAERESRNARTKALIAKHSKNRRFKSKLLKSDNQKAEKKSILKSVEKYTGEYAFGKVPKIEHLKEWIEKLFQYEDKLNKVESMFVAKCLKMVMRKWKLSHRDMYKLESIYARRTP